MKEKKRKFGGAEKARVGYCPFLGLWRDKEFWPCVAIVALCRDRF